MNIENNVHSTWTKELIRPPEIPTKADVVIIGGGIVGISTAYYLAKQGIDVCLCEKGLYQVSSLDEIGAGLEFKAEMSVKSL